MKEDIGTKYPRPRGYLPQQIQRLPLLQQPDLDIQISPAQRDQWFTKRILNMKFDLKT